MLLGHDAATGMYVFQVRTSLPIFALAIYRQFIDKPGYLLILLCNSELTLDILTKWKCLHDGVFEIPWCKHLLQLMSIVFKA